MKYLLSTFALGLPLVGRQFCTTMCSSLIQKSEAQNWGLPYEILSEQWVSAVLNVDEVEQGAYALIFYRKRRAELSNAQTKLAQQ